jgi:hypothetical protein
MLTGDLTGIIDPTQIVSTFIALAPVESIVIVTVLTLLSKVNKLWGLFQAIPRFTPAEQRYARNYAETWVHTEMTNWRDDHPGETPPWERA